VAKSSVLYSVTAILYFGAPASAMALGLLVAMGAREFIVHGTVGAVYPSIEVYDVSNAIATPDTTRPHTATLSAKSCRRCSAKPLFRIKPAHAAGLGGYHTRDEDGLERSLELKVPHPHRL